MSVISNNSNFSVRLVRRHAPDNTHKPFEFPTVRQQGISIGAYPEGTRFQRYITFDAEGKVIATTERINPDGTKTIVG